MMYLKEKQQRSNWKPSTQADYLNEARNRARGEISGKSDSQIKGLIGSNRAMYNASFMGLDEYGNPIDPEGNLAMLNAKLAVYQSALIKTDDKINDNKKENATDYYNHLEQLEDELWKARGDVLSDENIPMLADYTSMRTSGPEGGGMAGGAIGINSQLTQMDVLLSSIRDGFNSAGDAAVGAMTSSIQVFKQANSILQVFINSLVQATIQSLALKAVSTILGFAFGGPAGGALGAAVPFASGGIVTRPTMGLVGEAGPEAVIPLNRYNNLRERPVNITLAGELNVGLNDLRVRLLKVEESLNKYK